MTRRDWIKTAHINRRGLLKGLIAFLGTCTVGLGVGGQGGCESKGPKASLWSKSANTLYRAWSPPSEMVTLGQVILSEFHEIDQTISRQVIALTDDLSESGVHHNQAKRASDQEEVQLAHRIHQLHRQATLDGRWVEVRGWRLSEVEVAAYALIALHDQD